MKKSICLLFAIFVMCILFSGVLVAEEFDNSWIPSIAEGDILPAPEDDFFPLDEQITLKVLIEKKAKVTADYNEMPFIKELEEKTNINLEFEQVPQNAWDEKRNLKLATGQLPDLIIGNAQEPIIMQYAEYGVFPDMTDLINEHAPNIKGYFDRYPERKQLLLEPDGKIYTLPAIEAKTDLLVHEKHYINKKWLDKLGLDVPTTPDEFFDVLMAFKENDVNGNGDPDDEIPWSFMVGGKSWARNLDSMFGPWGVVDDQYSHIMMKDDKVLFVPMQDGYKEAIKFFHKCYKNGLIDEEVFTHSKNQYRSKGKQKDQLLGVFHENGTGMVGDDWENYTYIPDLIGPNGDQMHVYRGVHNDNNLYYITKANKYPVETIKLLDYLVQDDYTQWIIRNGPDGKAWKLLEDGRIERIETDYKKENNSFYSVTLKLYNDEWTDREIITPEDQLKRDAAKHYTQNIPEQNWPQGLLLSEEAQIEDQEISTVVNEYVDQKKAQWIINGKVEEEWDIYINKLKDMGIERKVALYQETYDQFKAVMDK